MLGAEAMSSSRLNKIYDAIESQNYKQVRLPFLGGLPSAARRDLYPVARGRPGRKRLEPRATAV